VSTVENDKDAVFCDTAALATIEQSLLAHYRAPLDSSRNLALRPLHFRCEQRVMDMLVVSRGPVTVNEERLRTGAGASDKG
jgi:hypothetical protein